MIKLNRINALVLACGLTLSASAFLSEKANAAPTATDTATFSGTVVPSCTLFSGNFGAATYSPVAPLGPSGGPRVITATSAGATFDCNTDTVTVKADSSTSQPIPVNATALIGTHVATVLAGATPLVSTTAASGTATVSLTGSATSAAAPTDVNGDIAPLTVTSTWTGGEDLFTGAYTASVLVTVTAN